jgi:hypothetical protein
MRIELLYFEGCPTYRNAEEDLRKVLAEEGVEAEVELIAVNNDEASRRLWHGQAVVHPGVLLTSAARPVHGSAQRWRPYPLRRCATFAKLAPHIRRPQHAKG